MGTRKEKILKIVFAIFRYAGIGACVIAVSYVSVALLVHTENEKRLMAENRMLKDEYSEMYEKVQMVGNVISDLEIRDRVIYKEVFNAELPAPAEDTSAVKIEDLFDGRTDDLVWDAYARTHKLDFTVSQVNAWIDSIGNALPRRNGGARSLPSMLPIKRLELMQTGATVGMRYSPFFKKLKQHNGIDLMAPVGTEVICTADGTVTGLSHSAKGLGNTVTVTHADGYRTVYAHLGDIFLHLGSAVKQGAPVGKVGVSGSCFASCLHYEVWKDGRCQDPVNYFFADLSPALFREVAMTAMTTGQAMD